MILPFEQIDDDGKFQGMYIVMKKWLFYCVDPVIKIDRSMIVVNYVPDMEALKLYTMVKREEDDKMAGDYLDRTQYNLDVRRDGPTGGFLEEEEPKNPDDLD